MLRKRGSPLRFVRAIYVCLIAAGLLAWASPSEAVSQFSRKYQVPCHMCHTAFPRLNYFGERFLRNGFQMPDLEPDGDTEGKTEIEEDFFSDTVGNWFGARLNMDAVRARSNQIVVGGDRKTQLSVGNPNWMQMFIAGSLMKNVSIFIENEHEAHGFKFTWFYFGFHNLGSKYVNFQLGNLSPVEFSSYPNRLRIFAPVKGDVFGVPTTGGAKAADNLSITGFRPGIQYYGHGGPVVWWAGITPGKSPEKNDDQHYWGGVKFEIPTDESPFQGSSVSLWAYQGKDGSANPTTIETDIENEFNRWQVQGNLRYRDLDVQVAYVDASDDNWDLNPTTPTKVDFSGVSIQSAYMAGKWYPMFAYDKITRDSAPERVAITSQKSIEKNIATFALAYHPRQNWRIGAYMRVDLMDENPILHPYKKHDFRVNIRTMF